MVSITSSHQVQKKNLRYRAENYTDFIIQLSFLNYHNKIHQNGQSISVNCSPQESKTMTHTVGSCHEVFL